MNADIAAVTAEVLDRVPHGVAVLTLTDDAGARRGMTVSSLTGASAVPPTVLVCVRNKASMHPWLVPGRVVGLSILGPRQAAVSDGFAFGVEDPCAAFPCRHEEGVAIVESSTAHLIGKIDRVVANRDTTIVIVAVERAEVTGHGALVHWMRGYYGDLVPVETGGEPS